MMGIQAYSHVRFINRYLTREHKIFRQCGLHAFLCRKADDTISIGHIISLIAFYLHHNFLQRAILTVGHPQSYIQLLRIRQTGNADGQHDYKIYPFHCHYLFCKLLVIYQPGF